MHPSSQKGQVTSLTGACITHLDLDFVQWEIGSSRLYLAVIVDTMVFFIRGIDTHPLEAALLVSVKCLPKYSFGQELHRMHKAYFQLNWK